MNIRKASVSLIEEDDIFKKIERCGRVCYKSEANITEDSAEKFVRGLINRQHYAMLEHATICISVPASVALDCASLITGTYVNITMNVFMNRYLISGNVRAWRDLFIEERYTESGWNHLCVLRDCLFQVLPENVYTVFFGVHTEPMTQMSCALLSSDDVLKLPNLKKEEVQSHVYITAHFVCDRGVSHELVRHRRTSPAQESTRYCNYSHSKFDNSLTFIETAFETPEQEASWLALLSFAEQTYMHLIHLGCSPQMARGVLPTDLKTELILTADLAEWQHILDLRYHGLTGAPHPKCKQVIGLWYGCVLRAEKYNRWII